MATYWIFEAVSLDEAEKRNMAKRQADGLFKQRYYNEEGKRGERTIIGGLDPSTGKWRGWASTYEAETADVLVELLNSAPKTSRPFPAKR